MPSPIIDKHCIELVTPRQDSQDLDTDMMKFDERYRLFMEKDMAICITDNPLGNLSFMGPEIIDAMELPVKGENIVVHLNTFHRKTDEAWDPAREQNEQDLDIILQHAQTLGIQYLLCVSGDGSERLPRLNPEDLDYNPDKVKTITSVQLMEHIYDNYSGFICGVAFNQYEPADEELEKLQRKFDAGARFIITQPVAMDTASDPRIGEANKTLEAMLKMADDNDVQVILEAWISKKLAPLMAECVGYDIHFGDFDPWHNLQEIRNRYSERMLYLSMVFGPKTLRKVQDSL
jgi:methylenetetrahydrofolate reductase (NADPH)